MGKPDPRAFRVNKFEHNKPGGWCKGEFPKGIIIRFFLLFVLWIWYSLVPHQFPSATLLLISLAMGAYTVWLFSKGRPHIGLLLGIATILNTILSYYITPDRDLFGFNMVLITTIYFILIVDIMLSQN